MPKPVKPADVRLKTNRGVQALLRGAAAVAAQPGIRVLAQHAAALLDGAGAFLDVLREDDGE